SLSSTLSRPPLLRLSTVHLCRVANGTIARRYLCLVEDGSLYLRAICQGSVRLGRVVRGLSLGRICALRVPLRIISDGRCALREVGARPRLRSRVALGSRATSENPSSRLSSLRGPIGHRGLRLSTIRLRSVCLNQVVYSGLALGWVGARVRGLREVGDGCCALR
ncbi:hypothetical protein PFISCL1PPCAC_5264, partial [Pristionchus fissidentatus]